MNGGFISVISCVNDRRVADQYLLKDLRSQDSGSIEIIILDNSSNQSFTSIARAYNAGGSLASSEYLMFVHQDVKIEDPNWLDSLKGLLPTLEFAVAGPSGIRGQEMYYSDNEVLRTNPELGFKSPILGDILDESVFIVRKSYLEKNPFSEDIIQGFHLCAAEYCLRALQDHQSVVLFPLPYSHFNLAAARGGGFESGSAKRAHVLSWMSAARRLSKAYPDRRIVTPQGRIGVRLFTIYALFYGVLMRIAPGFGLRLIDSLESNRLYLILNERGKGISYR